MRTSIAFVGAFTSVFLTALAPADQCNCGCKVIQDFGAQVYGSSGPTTVCNRLKDSAPYPYGNGIWVQQGFVSQWSIDIGQETQLVQYYGCELECEENFLGNGQASGDMQEAYSSRGFREDEYTATVPRLSCVLMPQDKRRRPGNPCVVEDVPISGN